MLSRPDAALVRPDANEVDVEADTTDDPVLRSVLTAPVRPGQPPAWESEVLEQAASGPWFEGAPVSADIAARSPTKR